MMKSVCIIALLVCLAISSRLLSVQSQTQAPTQAPKGENKAQAQKPEQDQTIRMTTELIEVRAVVTDKAGKPVTGLKQADFELLENNEPQEVSFFQPIELPGATAADSKSAGVNPLPTTVEKTPPARTIVLFADTLHIGTGNLLYLKRALRSLVDEKLGSQDMTALVTSFGTLGLGEQFTRDRRLLRYAIERLNTGPAERASAFNPYLAAQVDRGDRQAMNEAIRIITIEDHLQGMDRRTLESLAQARAREILQVAAYRSRATLLTLRSVVDRLATLPGQRLIVLFSDGFTLQTTGGSIETNEIAAVTSRAARAGVVIYSIDSKGLSPPPGFSAELSVQPDFHYASAGESDLANSLNALAADTGGQFLRNTNDLTGAAQRALDENRVFYTLAYYPKLEGNLNKFRKLTIRIKNHPEYQVRAQRGYLPAALAKPKTDVAKTPDQRLTEKMFAPLATTEIGMVAMAEDFETKYDAAQATLHVFLEGQTINFQPNNDRQQFELKIALAIFNSSGKLVYNGAQTLQGNLLSARAELVRRNGLHYTKRLELKPGFYQVRVGAYEASTQRIGTATALVEVPDLKRKRLTLSSLLIEGEQNLSPSALNKKNESETPGARTIQGIQFYARNQSFIYLFRLYPNSAQAAKLEELTLQTEIWQGEQKIAQTDAVPLTTRFLDRDEKGTLIGSEMRLNNFTPGLYELRVIVRGQQKKSVAQRAVVFGIE
jgi:VWFA-related protein